MEGDPLSTRKASCREKPETLQKRKALHAPRHELLQSLHRYFGPKPTFPPRPPRPTPPPPRPTPPPPPTCVQSSCSSAKELWIGILKSRPAPDSIWVTLRQPLPLPGPLFLHVHRLQLVRQHFRPRSHR